MIKFLKQRAWVLYLGAILAIYNFSAWEKDFYIIFVPTVLLISWKDYNKPQNKPQND